MLNRQDWLISNKFIFDPFQSGSLFAETDSLLDLPNMPSYIDREDIRILIGDLDEPGPCYIFAKPGCGKSSLRRRIHHEYESFDLISHKQKLLLVDYVNHNYSLDEAELRHHISRIIGLVEIALPVDFHDVKLALQISPELALSKLSKLCSNRGFSGLYVLVDNISDLETLSKVKSMIQNFMPSSGADKFYLVKYFLTDNLFSLTRSISLQNEFSPYLLIWNEDELSQILKQRLLACLDQDIRGNEINPISRFCDTSVIDVLQNHIIKLGALANSPRAMWSFGYRLFEEYLSSVNNSYLYSQNLINDNVLKRTHTSFFSNFSVSYESINQYMDNTHIKEYEIIDRKIFNLLKNRNDNYSQTKVYLCCIEMDVEKVKPIYLKLIESGYNPWMYFFNVLPGLDMREQRTLAIREAKNFLVFLSKNSYNKEGYFRKEIIDALDLWQTKLKNIPYLIPIRLEECSIPDNLTSLVYVDIFDNLGWDRLMLSLEESKKMRGSM